MDQEKGLEKPANPDLDVAVDELGECLALLIKAYRDAFTLVDGSAFIDERYYLLSITRKQVVKWFVEDHIFTHFVSISRELRKIQFRNVNQITVSSQKKLNDYAEFMEQSSKVLFSWKSLGKPLIYFFVILNFLFYFSTGRLIDLTSFNGILEWLSTIDWKSPDTFIFLLISLSLMGMLIGTMMYLFSYLVFLSKRVIFSGGTIRAKYGDFIPDWLTPEPEQTWQGIPDRNIYDLENKVYAIFRVKKPTEFPVDLVIGNWSMNFVFVVFLLLFVVFIYGVLWNQSRDEVMPFFWGALLFFVPLIYFIIKAWITYQNRKKFGNV